MREYTYENVSRKNNRKHVTMKYYITADVHGFYTKFHKALDEAGYFTDPEPHKLIILGDIFDRGQEAVEMQRFILSLLEMDAAILI